MDRMLRIGLIGGGRIAQVHAVALRLDGRWQLVAGVLSRNRDKSIGIGTSLGIETSRIYATPEEMSVSEAARDDGMDAVVIATPDDSHYSIAATFLRAGYHVICEKPMAIAASEAVELRNIAGDSRLVFSVAHIYSCYPMVRQAREMIRNGEIGSVTVAVVEHAHGRTLEPDASYGWRTDPDAGGEYGLLYNLATHAHHTLRFVCGLDPVSVSAEATRALEQSRVVDNAFVHLRFPGNATGQIWVSMIAAGMEHGLGFRVFGDKGSLHWRHVDPAHLVWRSVDGAARTLAASQHGLSRLATDTSRLTLGHPEGFYESFATLYREVADAIGRARAGEPTGVTVFPNAEDGVEGLRFIEATKTSARSNGAWTALSGTS